MKKLFLLLSILLSLCTMISCISEKVLDDDEPLAPLPVEKKYTFRVNATVESTPLSKQSAASDQIGLFIYKANRIDPIQRNKSATLSNGYYEYEVTTGDSAGYCFAYSPYSPALATGTTYTGTLSPTQNQTVSSSVSVASVPASLTNQLLMISNQSEEVNFVDQIANIQFKHVFSLLCFKITKDASLTQFSGQRIKKFEMYMAGRDTLVPLDVLYKFSGEYSIDLRYVPGTATYSEPRFSSASAKLTAEITNSPMITSNSNSPVVVWMVVPPFKSYTNKLVVRMETEDDNGLSFKTFSTFSEFGDILRNTMTSFSVNLTKANLYSDDVVKESFVDKPANSYVISEPGLYEIGVKKPGGGLLPEGVSVDWLWASKAGGGQFEIEELINDIAIDSEDPQNRKIRFRIGSELHLKKGNVILALKDANKNIVWTWHIWITDAPRNILYGSRVFLDRNIGALSADTASAPAVDIYGFVYQWGRKDPFFGGDGRVFDEADSRLSVARTHTIVNETSGQWNPDVNKWSEDDASIYGTMEQSLKYPMKFIYNGNPSSEEDEPADWLVESNTGLWSDAAKTDYDPCPYGYRAPSGYKVAEALAVSELSMLHNGYTEYQLYIEALEENPNTLLPAIWFYNHYNSNRYWVYSGPSGHTVWPTAGMRQGRDVMGKWIGAQLLYSGTDEHMGKGYYWTSTPLEISGRKVPGASSRICIYNTLLYSNTDFGPNADAYPVRCLKYE
jgi:hypothetical protein